MLSLEKASQMLLIFLHYQHAFPQPPLSPKNPVYRPLSRLTPRKALPNVLRSVITKMRNRICQLEEADQVLRSIERMELAGRACAVLP